MNSNRTSAMDQVLNRKVIEVKLPSNRISEYYGSNVFSDEIMRKHLSEEAYYSVKTSIHMGQKIDRKIADQVATLSLIHISEPTRPY